MVPAFRATLERATRVAKGPLRSPATVDVEGEEVEASTAGCAEEKVPDVIDHHRVDLL